jgi:hypothetical protein
LKSQVVSELVVVANRSKSTDETRHNGSKGNYRDETMHIVETQLLKNENNVAEESVVFLLCHLQRGAE